MFGLTCGSACAQGDPPSLDTSLKTETHYMSPVLRSAGNNNRAVIIISWPGVTRLTRSPFRTNSPANLAVYGALPCLSATLTSMILGWGGSNARLCWCRVSAALSGCRPRVGRAGGPMASGSVGSNRAGVVLLPGRWCSWGRSGWFGQGAEPLPAPSQLIQWLLAKCRLGDGVDVWAVRREPMSRRRAPRAPLPRLDRGRRRHR